MRTNAGAVVTTQAKSRFDERRLIAPFYDSGSEGPAKCFGIRRWLGRVVQRSKYEQ
jgi:hypothetical protein